MIPYGRQTIGAQDIEAVISVLESDFLTQGPMIPAFEEVVSQACSAQYAVAVNSGTSALHVACMALGVAPGDTVWTSPNTFVASANCARYCGADVDFVDIDPNTWCLSVERLREKLEKHRTEGLELPSVVIPVHLSGQSCDMRAIARLGEEYGFRIIEDASHALGATYLDEPVGCCRYSDITVLSLHPVKIITSGEGGLAVTNDEELYQRMCMLRTHGITRDERFMTGTSPGPWYYQQIMLGFNYRLTDIAAALGLSQMNRLAEFVERRNELCDVYERNLDVHGICLQRVPESTRSARHLFVVRVDPRRHLDLFLELRTAGIGVNLHYTPVYLQPYYRELGFSEGLCPEAEAYGREAITLPLFPGLSAEEQRHVIDSVLQSVRA